MRWAYVTFPLFDFASIRAREAGTVRNHPRGDCTISTNHHRADDASEHSPSRRLKAPRKIAANTPVAVSAAMTASQQATARYQAGLGTIVEVADAQRLLTQSEIDDALARLGVWRALLSTAPLRGDIQPFLASATP